MFASALGEACPIGLDPMRVHEPVHEVEQATDGDSGMQGSLVPTRGEHRVVSGVFNLESSGVDAPDWDSGSSMGGHHTPHSGEDSAE
jgi:hypothetical protein